MDWPPVSGNIQYIQCDKDNKTLEVVCSSDQRRFCVLDWTVDFKGSFRPASPGCRCEHSHSSQVQTRTEVVSFRSLIGSGTVCGGNRIWPVWQSSCSQACFACWDVASSLFLISFCVKIYKLIHCLRPERTSTGPRWNRVLLLMDRLESHIKLCLVVQIRTQL